MSFDRNYICQCPFGVSGAQCELVIDNCASQPCLNAGSCSQPQIGVYRCSCPLGYTGRRCEIKISACTSGLCQNGATCIESSSAIGYVCQCQAGFTGTILSLQIGAELTFSAVAELHRFGITLGLESNYRYT